MGASAKALICIFIVALVVALGWYVFPESAEQQLTDIGAADCVSGGMRILYPTVKYRVSEYRTAHSAAARWLTVFEVKVQDVNNRKDYYTWVCAESHESTGWVVLKSEEAI